MYPSVMPQSEILAKMEDNAGLADKSLALRESERRNQATVDDDEESNSDSSGVGSDSDSDVTTLSTRPTDQRRHAESRPDRRSSGSQRHAWEDQRPRSPDRRGPVQKPSQTRPKSASPAIRHSQRSVSRPGLVDAMHAIDSGMSNVEIVKSGRPRSSTSPPEPISRPGSRKRPVARNSSPPADKVKPTASKRPNALSFLDPDSPEITEDQIRRVIAEASGQWSPRSASSSASSSDSLDHRSAAETDATTPEQSVNGDVLAPFAEHTFSQSGDSRSPGRLHRSPSRQDTAAQEHKYGTPEMARGPAKHPHLPPKELQPRITAPGQGHAKHLPRAEKLPMSGYELLAAKLSSPDGTRARRRSYSKAMPAEEGEASIKPIYRRFEALNHRLLLHLQDELSELEEQLHRLDTADTQTRRLANCILPASRRAEFMAGGELQWHKTDILGKIGFKLGQYNHALTTFKETQALTPASLADVETYRTYLATRNPIAEIETRFLDPADDLVCLRPANGSPPSSSTSSISPTLSEDMLTPMPLKTTFGFSPSPSTTAATSRKPSVDTQDGGAKRQERPGEDKPAAVQVQSPGPAGQAAGLAAFAIVGPILAFPIVRDFVGRMAVVLVAGLAVAALRQRIMDSGAWEGGQVGPMVMGESGDGMVLVGVYAVVMAVIAMLF